MGSLKLFTQRRVILHVFDFKSFSFFLFIQLFFSFYSFSQGPNPKVGLQVGGNKNPNALCENDTIQLINLTKDSAKTIVYYVFNYNFKKDAAYPNYTDTFKGKDTAYHIYKFHDSVALKNCKKNSVKIYVSLTAHDKYGDDYEIITNITLFFRPRARFSGNSPVCVGKEVAFSNYSCPKDSVKFLWEIDGKTYSTYDIKYTFNKAGRYKVKLTVTSGKPCNYSDSSIQYIDVYDYPKPDFKFQTLRKNGVICFGKDTLMIINTSKTYTSIRWQIEKYDTNSFKLVKGSHLGSDTVYFVPKKTMTFWAKLTAYNGVCQDTARRKYFKVIVSPEMKLSTYPRCISGTSITLGKYLDTSKGVPDAFRWKLKGPNYSDSFTTLYPSQISGLKYGKYYVEIQSNGVCDSFVNRDSFFIAPPLTKPSLITFCDSKDTVFLLKKAFKSFPAGFGAKWSGSSLLKDSTFNPFKKSTGTYKFYLTDTFSNCIKDTVTIKVIPASPVYFKDSIICILKDSFLLHPSYKGLFVGKGVRKNYFIPSLADTGNHRIIYYSDTSVKCPFQDTSYITVTANIKAAFTVKTPNCLDSIYHLVNTTAAPTYRWTFSDKTTPASGKTYDKKFSSAGKFTIQLTVGKKGGCLDSITKDVIVYTKPQLKSQYTIDSSKCDSVLLNFKITTPDSAQKYDWIIGSKTYSGVSITLKQPRNVSSYYLKYKVTGKNLCGSISDSSLIRIPPKFNAGIKIKGQAKSCTPFTTSFTNTTYGQVDSFRVFYGNGQTTKNSLSGMTYSNSGTKDTIFKILIKAYSKSCGLSKDSTFITVAPNLIKPTFSFNTPGCINTNISFTNTSSDSVVSWNFGDAGTSTQQNPQHKYTKIGNYTVSVIFKAKYNCTATSSKTIAIYDKPLLTKKYTIDSSKCDSVYLRFYITNPDTAQNYVWNVGSSTINGDTVNLTLPKNSKNSYITKYKVTGKNLCGTISDSGLIRIPPKINAGIKINGQSKSCTPFTTSFTNTTYGQVDSFRVFYGNGQSTKNTLNGTTYSNSGTTDTSFKILIKAYSKSCGLSKDSTYITVAPNLIKPTFSFNTPGCINTNISFTNTSSDSVVSWNFGDAGTSTQQNPQHKYTKIGNYTVSVIFKAKYNCTATSSKTIAIYDKPLLTKKYTIDSSKCDSVYLRFYITNPDTAQNYVWNVGSSTINGDTVSLTLPKSAKSSYTTKYKVTGKNLCGTISDSGLIRIPPKFNAGIKINGQSKSCTPFTTSFTNTTYGQVDSFRVTYGNGQTTKNSLSGMTYSNSGTKDTIFKILIKAYSKSCGLSKDSTFITVAPNLIKPTFSVNSPGCINTNLNYNNTSSDSIVSWDFGDAGTSTQQNPQHKYTKIGNYKISVIFKAKYNCTATSSKMIAIYDKPLLTKKYTIDSSKCDSVSLRFYITNPDTAQAYVWNIGSTTINGDTVNLTLPKNSKNSYITKYKVTGKNLCGTISDSGLIRIPPKINAGIKINGQSKSCTPFKTSFTNTTYGQVDSFRVFYGNGQTTKNSLSVMTYSNATTKDTIFKILIKAYSKTCGLSKDSTFITVAPNLINSSFNVKTPGCLDSVFYFTNSSKDSIVSWNFGDGKYSTAQNTSHKYSNVGYYAIKVAFKASFGCKDTGTKNIRVIVKPKIGLKYSIDSSHCDTNYLILNVLNYDAVNSYTWNVGSKWSSNKISDTVKIPQQFINFQIPIKLSSKNICGTDAVKDSAFIAIGFKADIVINGLTKSCSPFTPTFDNHTTGRVTSYKVYYGNGDSSVNSIKKITYYNSTDSTISYRVILKAFNPNCGYRSDTTYIFLRPNKVKPIGQYSNAVFCDKEVVTFINKSSPEAKVELQWGDGIVAYNLKYNDTIKHIYSKPGSYTTTLIAESCGVDTSKKYGIIIDKIPEVDFITIPKSLCAGQPIVFAKTSDSSYTDRWKINGTDTANKLDSFTKVFNKPGIYKIEILVNSMLNNCQNSLSKDIKIEPEPTLNFSLDYLFGCVPLQLCGHAKGNFQFLNIDWGNGKGGSKLDTCNTYLTADTFTVSVKATTFNGCFINQKSNVIVLPKPDAKYVVKIDSMPCSSIRIYGKITDPHPINKYTWTFNTNTILGDTFNFNKQKETDRKSELLNLTVSNQCGSKSFTDLISIPPDWKAILSVNGVNNGCDPFDAKFFNYTKGKVDSFTVDYGNGKKSINKITDMTYINKTGGTIIFPVVLTIFNKICPPVSDTTFITVYPNKIKLGEEHSRNKYCDGEEIYFINRSSPGAKVTFHFGDGVSVTKIYTYGDTVKHFYTKPGKYNISAVTKNPCFGDSVNLFTVDILEKPAIIFSANYEPICEDFPVTFTNYTTNATNIIWVIDGLDTIRQQNQFDYKFKLFGQHIVKLIAESISTSCLNEMTKVIQVMPKPVYTLGLDTPICVGQTVCMSIGGNVKKISIDWNNNKFGSINDTCTTYMKAGYYTVNSLVESNEGCREINSKKINVHKLPTVTIYPDKDLINLDLADSIFLNFNKNQPFKKYTWYYNGDTICDDGNPICDSIKAGPFYYTTLEKFGVMLIDQFGCFATDEINIQVVSAGNYFVPNAFSPNNDGNNDLFFPIIYDPEIYSFDMRIYNRWGELLLKMDNLEPNKYGWDGVYKGVPSQMDVYMVIIQFNRKNNKYDLYKGLIHLIK